MFHIHRWGKWKDVLSKVETRRVEEWHNRGYGDIKEKITTETMEKVVFTQERRCNFCNLLQVQFIRKEENKCKNQ